MNPALIHQVIIDNNDWYQAQQWCEENIGEFDRDWYKLGIDPAASLISGKVETVWYFRDPKDAVLFTLRWK